MNPALLLLHNSGDIYILMFFTSVVLKIYSNLYDLQSSGLEQGRWGGHVFYVLIINTMKRSAVMTAGTVKM